MNLDVYKNSFNPITMTQSGTRKKDEKPDPYRSCFQCDRDRILHAKSFRRLTHKTQVFLSPEGDHYTNRLTHSLEVSQISRTIARALSLNEDLVEAISLGHDLGHTPFGHAGERALQKLSLTGFKHEEQSVRVVEYLEKEGKGLNLTEEVLDGILNHSLSSYPFTNEGCVVRITDKIAYLNHDAEDAIRAGVLGVNEFPIDVLAELGRTKSERITTLVSSVIENSKDKIQFSSKIDRVFHLFRKFMFSEVYTNPLIKSEESKAEALIEQLFSYYQKHPKKLPEEYQKELEIDPNQAIVDFISGMTDRYATMLYQELFIPKSWQLHFNN